MLILVPIGALLVSNDAPRGFAPGDHASTFGGNPVASAAACAVLDTVDDALLAHVRELSALLAEGLAGFGEVRGKHCLLVDDEIEWHVLREQLGELAIDVIAGVHHSSRQLQAEAAVDARRRERGVFD